MKAKISRKQVLVGCAIMFVLTGCGGPRLEDSLNEAQNATTLSARSKAKLRVVGLKCSVPEGTEVGRLYAQAWAGGYDCGPILFAGYTKDDADFFGAVLVKRLTNSGYNVVANSPIFGEMADAEIADFAIGGLVKNVRMDERLLYGKVRVDADIEVLWQLLDLRSGSTVFSGSYKSRAQKEKRTLFWEEYTNKSEINNQALLGASAKTFNQLLNDEAFVSCVKDPQGDQDDTLNKMDMIFIPKVKADAVGNSPEMLNKAFDSVVVVKTNKGHGSGFAITDKYVLTNYHVVHGKSEIELRTKSGKTMKCKVLRGHQGFDVALLELDADSIPPIPLCNSDFVRVGDEVYAIGAPVDVALSHTVTKGIISGVRQSKNGVRFIQTDVAVNPGNSGGPLLSDKGEVTSLVTIKRVFVDNVTPAEGLAFCVSINDALRVLKVAVKE